MDYTISNCGSLIKELRRKKNITQEDLAHRINKKRSYISRVENSGMSINLKTLQEIVEIGFGGKIKIEL